MLEGKSKKLVERDWQNVAVGDIIKLRDNDQVAVSSETSLVMACMTLTTQEELPALRMVKKNVTN